MILNPNLYSLLCKRFRPVLVANEGEGMVCRYMPDPIKGGNSLQIDSFGEGYRLNCLFCNDTRQRLYINHRYGMPDPITGSDNLHLWKCFNEECQKEPVNRKLLAHRVFGMINRKERELLSLRNVRQGRPALATPLTQSEPPGALTYLEHLEPDHPARQYLLSRGFDLGELSRTWNVLYCEEAGPAYPVANNRLIIPVIMNDLWVGWQARAVPGLGSSWGDDAPKYFTMPGLRKSRLVYNHDLARKQPFVVICEGPTDVWRVGPAGVALLGKQASPEQLRLIAAGWSGKPVVALLDADAAAESDLLVAQLRRVSSGGVVQIRLPQGQDPGDMNRQELWALIREQAARQQVDLPPVP